VMEDELERPESEAVSGNTSYLPHFLVVFSSGQLIIKCVLIFNL